MMAPYAVLHESGRVDMCHDDGGGSGGSGVRVTHWRCALTTTSPVTASATLSVADAVALRERFKTEVLGIPYAFEAHLQRGDVELPYALDTLWQMHTAADPAAAEWVTPTWAKARPILEALSERTLFHGDRLRAIIHDPFVPYASLTTSGQVTSNLLGRLTRCEVMCPLIQPHGGQLFADVVDASNPGEQRHHRPGSVLDITDAVALRGRFKTDVLGIPTEFEVQVHDYDKVDVPVTLDEVWRLWQSLSDARRKEWIANPREARRLATSEASDSSLYWVAERWFGFCAYQQLKSVLLALWPNQWVLFLGGEPFCIEASQQAAVDKLACHRPSHTVGPSEYYLTQILP